MRQRGGGLYTQVDSQKKFSFPRENNGEPLYGVVVKNREGVETERNYYNEEKFKKIAMQALEIEEEELKDGLIQHFEGGTLRFIKEHGLFYLYYEYRQQLYGY